MDIATLGIRVENGQVIQATKSLEGMTVAGTKTEAATQRLTRRMALAEIEARKMDAAMGRMSPTMTKLAGAFAGFSAIAVVGLIGRETIKNTIEAQDAMAQLEAAVRSTGAAAGRTVEQLDALSMQLQKQTTFSDEAVKGAEAMLLTFDKIRGTEFDRATAAVTDLATRMGGDLSAAAVQVGKALQDPVTGLSALRRSGVSFSATQIEVIKNLYETGRAAEGQRVILAELEHQFGGSAAAARDTLGGALKALGNAWGDLFEVTRGASQGSVDAINAITRALEKSGFSMNQQLTQMTIDWETMKASILEVKAIMVTPISLTWAAEVRVQMDKIEYDLSVKIAELRKAAKAGGVMSGAGSGLPTSAADAVDRAAREAQEIADRQANAQNQLAIDEIRKQEKYVEDITEIWKSGVADVVRSTEQGFRAILNSVGNLVGSLIERMAREGKSSGALGAIQAGISGGMIGYGAGGMVQGRAGGAVAGALSGAVAGNMALPGGIGAAAGALAGFIGGIFGAGNAANEAAKQMQALKFSLANTIEAWKAELAGDPRGVAIAGIHARAAEALGLADITNPNGDAIRAIAKMVKDIQLYQVLMAQAQAKDVDNALARQVILDLETQSIKDLDKATRSLGGSMLNLANSYKVAGRIFEAIVPTMRLPVPPTRTESRSSGSVETLQPIILQVDGRTFGETVVRTTGGRASGNPQTGMIALVQKIVQ